MKRTQWFFTALFTGTVEILLGIVSNLISTLLERFLDMENLMVPVLVLLSTICLLLLRTLLSEPDSWAVDLQFLKQGAMSGVFDILEFMADCIRWGAFFFGAQFALLLGLMTTIGAMVLLVRNDLYPARVALQSWIFWGQVLLWVGTFIPLSVGASFRSQNLAVAESYRAKVRVRSEWRLWCRMIHRIKKDNKVRQDDLQTKMPGHSSLEVVAAMKLYSYKFRVALEQETIEIRIKVAPSEKPASHLLDWPTGMGSTRTADSRFPKIDVGLDTSALYNVDRLSSMFDKPLGEGILGNRMGSDIGWNPQTGFHDSPQPEYKVVKRTIWVLKW